MKEKFIQFLHWTANNNPGTMTIKIQVPEFLFIMLIESLHDIKVSVMKEESFFKYEYDNRKFIISSTSENNEFVKWLIKLQYERND